MYSLEIIQKDEKGFYTIFAKLVGSNDLELLKQATENCTLLNNIFSKNFYFISNKGIHEFYPPFTENMHKEIVPFIRKWKKEKELVNELYKLYFVQNYNVPLDEALHYNNSPIKLLIIIHYLNILNLASFKDYLDHINGQTFMTKIIIATLKYCNMIEEMFDPLHNCPTEMLKLYNLYLGLSPNNIEKVKNDTSN